MRSWASPPPPSDIRFPACQVLGCSLSWFLSSFWWTSSFKSFLTQAAWEFDFLTPLWPTAGSHQDMLSLLPRARGATWLDCVSCLPSQLSGAGQELVTGTHGKMMIASSDLALSHGASLYSLSLVLSVGALTLQAGPGPEPGSGSRTSPAPGATLGRGCGLATPQLSAHPPASGV